MDSRNSRVQSEKRKRGTLSEKNFILVEFQRAQEKEKLWRVLPYLSLL